MHYIMKFGIGALAATLMVACGSSDSSKTTTTTTAAAATATTAASPTTAASTTTRASSGSSASTTASSTGSSAAGATGATAGAVSIGTTTLGKVLVDGDGRTLYLFTKDTQNKASVCESTCATIWPPDTVTGSPVAGTGIEASKLSVIKRSDGTEQVAYNGWPLYRYSKDAKAGDNNGEGVQGVWFAVDATGTAMKA